jgi:acetoin utilization deacetylase AcuC-like enzyme
MNFGYRESCLDHDTGPRHPESAERLRAIRETLAERHGVAYVEPDDVDRELLESVHEPEYLDSVEEFCDDGGGNWDADTVAVRETWPAALASAGMAEWVATEALSGAEGRETPFSLGRPPGHHAIYDDAMGFCYINNAVVGAQAALDRGADRVAIVDWDVHHGNGNQDLCYQRGDVLTVSIHEDGLYPGTGDVEETGVGDGELTNCNVPLPPGSSDVEYRAAIEGIVEPTLATFDPDVVLVSAGFDAHEDDPISRMSLTTEGFGYLAAALREAATDCDAGIGFVLEGGYGLETVSASIARVNEVFDGYEPERPSGEANEGTRAVIDTLRDQGIGSR